jgi:Family of unknown function (DUF6230)
MGNPEIGKTRWRRFTILFAPALAVVGLMVYGVLTGVVAVSFAISGMPFKLSASNMSGNGFVQYATVDPVTNASTLPSASTAGNNVADTVTVLGTAQISNLHQTVCAGLPGGGNLLVTIDAGGGGNPATASNLVVDAPLLTASDATFTNINIGEDLGSASGGAANGLFSQTATHVSINNLNQLAVSTSAGTFTLTGLTLSSTFVATCP